MSVSQLYQMYLKNLSYQERLELIRLLVDTTLPEYETYTSPKTYNVLDFSGKGMPYARPEDAQESIDKLRSEWD